MDTIVTVATPMSDTEQQIAGLQQTISDLRANLNEARIKHNDDVQAIGEALIDEANTRGWCREYDKFVNELNGSLNIQLPLRNRDYIVTQTYRVTRTITISAVDSDDALEQADTASYIGDLDDDGWYISDVDLIDSEADED